MMLIYVFTIYYMRFELWTFLSHSIVLNFKLHSAQLSLLFHGISLYASLFIIGNPKLSKCK